MKIIVLGDIILDVNYLCETHRKAPEADIPVYSLVKTDNIIGGAANVALNLRRLRCDVELISVIGNDTNGMILTELLNKNGVKTKVFIDVLRKTTTKTRLFCENKLVTRYDVEDTADIKDTDYILEYIKKIEGIDAIVLSDYNKGVLTEELCKNVILEANMRRVPVFVDPKTKNVDKYAGCFCFKPNRVEGEIISGRSGVDDIITTIKNKINCENVVLTSGEDGIYVNGEQNHITHTTPIDVIDVTGCGDVVFSILVYEFLLHGDLFKAAEIANYVAGKSTQVVGNYVVSNKDLDDARQNWERAQKKVVVFTNGCFDIIHSAHVRLLKYCKSLGDILVVGINSDDSVKRLKGDSRPINGIEERCELLNSLGFVDRVVVFSEDTPFNILSELKPDIIVKGGDYTPDTIVGKEFAKEVVIYNYIPNLSTTNIVKKITNGSKRTFDKN